MSQPRVFLGEYTATAFAAALAEGSFELGIIPVGAVEDHYEHCPLDHDIRSATRVATEVAQRLYPRALVLPPMPAGLGEWKIDVPGTVRLQLSTMLAYLYDLVESMTTHGMCRFLVINGHLGNHTILEYGGEQLVRRYPAGWRVSTYWNVLTDDEVTAHLSTGRMPGHATEFETSLALAWFPELVDTEAMINEEALAASAETGHALGEIIIERNVAIAEEMLAEEAPAS